MLPISPFHFICLFQYAALLIIILLAEIVGAILAAVFRNEVNRQSVPCAKVILVVANSV